MIYPNHTNYRQNYFHIRMFTFGNVSSIKYLFLLHFTNCFSIVKEKKLGIENQIKTEEHVDLVLVPLVNINNNR